MATLIGARHDQAIWHYLELTKPSGGADIITSLVGMFLRHPRRGAVDGADFRQPGIACVLPVARQRSTTSWIDTLMARTQKRPIAQGR